MTRTVTPVILLLTTSAFIGLEGSSLPHPPAHQGILPPWVKPTTGAILKGDTRTSEDATAALGAHVESLTFEANNQKTTVPISPSVPLAQALLSVLEEMEETFQLVTQATVVPLSSTKFNITVAGYYNSEDRFVCGGACIGASAAIISAVIGSGWWGY